MTNELVVLNDKKEPTTTSIMVADHFGKQHKNVMQSIRNITEPLEDSNGLNFQLKDKMVTVGYGQKKMPVYEMNRKGFMILVMGFTGDKALKFKNDFVDAFDGMEKALLEQQ